MYTEPYTQTAYICLQSAAIQPCPAVIARHERHARCMRHADSCCASCMGAHTVPLSTHALRMRAVCSHSCSSTCTRSCSSPAICSSTPLQGPHCALPVLASRTLHGAVCSHSCGSTCTRSCSSPAICSSNLLQGPHRTLPVLASRTLHGESALTPAAGPAHCPAAALPSALH
jgi:hypothetical protein